MAKKIVMPRLGLTMTEGKLLRWLCREGEAVSSGQPLFEVMTDKVTMAVESPADGVLSRILVGPGQTVPVGTEVGIIAAPGEAVGTDVGTIASPGEAVVPRAASEAGPAPRTGHSDRARAVVRATPAARRLARELGVDLASVPGSGPDGVIREGDVKAAAQAVRGTAAESARRVSATPLARAVAREAGIDLAAVPGTGPGGKVTRADVLARVAVRGPAVPGVAPGRTVPLEGRRKIIAERMAQSARTTAAVTLTLHADMSRCRQMKESLVPAVRELGYRLTFTDIIVKVVALALRRFPPLNASLVGEEIVCHERVNVGIAVDVEEGLLVPVIPDADVKGLAELAAWRERLVEAARSGTIGPDELSGGTFTVTNLGMYDIEAFSPIINSPEAAILGVGKIEERPVVVEGQVQVRPLCCLSLVFDHRLVDGGPAARFLQWVKSRLENPYLLLL